MLNTAQGSNTVKTALDKVFLAEFEYQTAPYRATAKDGDVFKQDTTDRSAIITEQFQGTGYYSSISEQQDLPQGTARVGNNKVTTVLDYAKSVPISRRYFKDEQFGVVNKMMTDEGRLARMSQDRNAFAAYRNGLTGSTQTTNDGVALISDSHLTLNGTTVDNKETGVLNNTNLDTCFVSLKKQKTQDGTLGGHEPNVLLVPTTLLKTAIEVTQSELRTGTTNNDLNYYSQVYPGLVVKETPFLDSQETNGSATGYFLLSRGHSVTRFVREGISTNLNDTWATANLDYIYKVLYREVTDTICYEGIVGSTGLV